MIKEERRMLKSKGSKICKSVFKYNFAQELDFFHYERNILINTADIINVNKTKNRELFIKAFFNIFA